MFANVFGVNDVAMSGGDDYFNVFRRFVFFLRPSLGIANDMFVDIFCFSAASRICLSTISLFV